jgi:hypothetical protein
VKVRSTTPFDDVSAVKCIFNTAPLLCPIRSQKCLHTRIGHRDEVLDFFSGRGASRLREVLTME